MSPCALPDLHRHLDGSLRPSTLSELANIDGKPIPGNLQFHAGMGLGEALSRFQFTLSLLQSPERVQRIASEMCEDALAEGVTTLEIRFAPQLHLERGAKMPAIVDAAIEGTKHRAGIILCALYGEPLALVDELVEIARTRKGVVGVDLAGGPAPSHNIKLEDYAPAFRRARDLGIGRTVHASEGRPPKEIEIAIKHLHAQRIGHGTTLLDDPTVVDLVLTNNVVIEACPTSNVHTGVIAKLEDHPIGEWLDRGIKACINTDNTLLSNVSSTEEHARARTIRGMTDAKLEACITTGHASRFIAR